MKKLLVLSFILVMLVSLIVSGCAQSKTTSSTGTSTAANPSVEIIKLTFSTHEPATSLRQTNTQAVLFDRIEKESNGRVKIERFYGGALIPLPSSWDELLKGTADIVDLNMHASPGPSIMPIQTSVQSFFYEANNIRSAFEAYDRLLKAVPEFAAEFAKVKRIMPMGIGEQQLHSTVPVRTLADFKGLKLRTTGPMYATTWKKLGAEPVAMGVNDLYTSLEKGILNGVMHPGESLKSYRFSEVTKYSTMLNVLDGCGALLGMNKQKFDSLPPDIQKIFDDNLQWAYNQYLDNEIKINKEGYDFATQKGHEYINLSAQEIAMFRQYMTEEARTTAEGLNGKGLPGTKLQDLAHQYVLEANEKYK